MKKIKITEDEFVKKSAKAIIELSKKYKTVNTVITLTGVMVALRLRKEMFSDEENAEQIENKINTKIEELAKELNEVIESEEE